LVVGQEPGGLVAVVVEGAEVEVAIDSLTAVVRRLRLQEQEFAIWSVSFPSSYPTDDN
jgi:hypothetical protein